MSRRTRNKQETESLDVFPAFTDLMSNAFMILSLFLLLALIESQRLNYNLAKANERLKSATPILIDEQSGQFSFTPNSATLSPDLKAYIHKSIIPNIQDIIKKHDIESIQVIGHTDGQEINRSGNLDRNLQSVAFNKQSVEKLIPGSNTDLGLMRAIAVFQELKNSGQVEGIKLQAYSAAQLYDAKGNLAKFNRQDDSKRRRIEIRFIPPGEKQ